ncbi:MAG: hypothetical protein CME68_11820 [Halobacteriovoraceae bacterium]|nr:hypothetical protein [Halobacteriovoraceae bacterium]
MQKLIVLFFITALSFNPFNASAKEKSKALPMTLMAIDIILNPSLDKNKKLLRHKDLKHMVTLLKKQNISHKYLKKVLNKWNSVLKMDSNDLYSLREDNESDKLIKKEEFSSLGPIGASGDFSDWSFDMKAALDELKKEKEENSSLTRRTEIRRPLSGGPESRNLKMPRIALHAHQLEVIDAKDEFMKDDIYFFFYATDGATTVGRVTDIYKGLSGGQSFFLSATDRVLFPTKEVGFQAPYKHLIVDFSIIESDGDDIKEMQKISQAILPLAASAYGLYAGGGIGSVISSATSVALRKEVQKLSESLLALNNDDRLINESLIYSPKSLEKLFLEEDIFQFFKVYEGSSQFSSWKYKLHFRVFKD